MFTALEVQSLFCFVLVFIYLFFAALSLHCCVQALCFQWVGATLRYGAQASLVAEYGLQALRLQGLCFVGSRAQAQKLWHRGFIALKRVESSQTRSRTCIVPCISRQILNH